MTTSLATKVNLSELRRLLTDKAFSVFSNGENLAEATEEETLATLIMGGGDIALLEAIKAEQLQRCADSLEKIAAVLTDSSEFPHNVLDRIGDNIMRAQGRE